MQVRLGKTSFTTVKPVLKTTCIQRSLVYKDHLVVSQQCVIQCDYDLYTETTSVQRPLFSGPYVVVIAVYHIM